MKREHHLNSSELQILQQFKERVEKKFPLNSIVLFGSKARGDSTGESDLDVMIVTEENTPQVRADLYDLTFEFDLEYAIHISPTIFSRKELEEGPLSESPLYKAIQREGIQL
ncbi:MAG: nucleotidyltransferase domain-containing protein [Vulcanimicrobiota bacterium]